MTHRKTTNLVIEKISEYLGYSSFDRDARLCEDLGIDVLAAEALIDELRKEAGIESSADYYQACLDSEMTVRGLIDMLSE